MRAISFVITNRFYERSHIMALEAIQKRFTNAYQISPPLLTLKDLVLLNCNRLNIDDLLPISHYVTISCTNVSPYHSPIFSNSQIRHLPVVTLFIFLLQNLNQTFIDPLSHIVLWLHGTLFRKMLSMHRVPRFSKI